MNWKVLLYLLQKKTPLYDYFISKEFQDNIMSIVHRTLMIVPDTSVVEMESLKEDLKKKIIELNIDPQIIKPDIAVMDMNTRQIQEYLPKFVDSIYKFNGIKVENKWRIKKSDGSIKPPTPPLPGWNPNIIDPYVFGELGKGLGKGSTWKMKLQLYNIMLHN